MADLLKLRQAAKRAGMAGTRGAGRAELEAFLAENGATAKATPRKKKRPTSAPAKRTTAKRRNTGRTTATRKAPVRKPAARAAKPKAPKATPRQSKNAGGRNPIDTRDLDFNAEGFNPRAGGDRELVFKAVKKARGNRDKAFTALLPNMARLVPAKKQNGEKRTKAEKESYLRYLINRIIFDFAVATGQHAASQNRAEYGTGGTGQGIFKRGKRKPAAKPKTTARKPRAKATTAPKRRGRPPGSKNKPATAKRTTGRTGTRKSRARSAR